MLSASLNKTVPSFLPLISLNPVWQYAWHAALDNFSYPEPLGEKLTKNKTNKQNNKQTNKQQELQKNTHQKKIPNKQTITKMKEDKQTKISPTKRNKK